LRKSKGVLGKAETFHLAVCLIECVINYFEALQFRALCSQESQVNKQVEEEKLQGLHSETFDAEI
jgi:hypothetical protein